jgi:hypothetical protein
VFVLIHVLLNKNFQLVRYIVEFEYQFESLYLIHCWIFRLFVQNNCHRVVRLCIIIAMKGGWCIILVVITNIVYNESKSTVQINIVFLSFFLCNHAHISLFSFLDAIHVSYSYIAVKLMKSDEQVHPI